MSDDKKKGAKTTENSNPETTPGGDVTPISGELVKASSKSELAAKDKEAAAFMAGLGLKVEDLRGFEQTASGDLTKWFDLRAMMEDPSIPDKLPAKAKPNVGFAGVLLGMGEMQVDPNEAGAEEIEDEETGEVRSVRYFYFVRLISTCPVSWKNDNNEDKTAVAQPGEIIAVGERFAFKKWRALATDGGVYQVVVQPVERRRLRRNPKRCMWHFNVWEKTLKPAAKLMVTTPPPAAAAR